MKNGDISNQLPLVIAFKLEGTVVDFKGKALSSFLRNKLQLKGTCEYKDTVIELMEWFFYRTEYTIDLVVNRETYNKCSWVYEDLPFSRIIIMDKFSQITSRLLMGDITYYVDNSAINRSQVNNKYALSVEELRDVLKFI